MKNYDEIEQFYKLHDQESRLERESGPYHQHIDGMVSQLERHFSRLPRSFVLACYIHDIVADIRNERLWGVDLPELKNLMYNLGFRNNQVQQEAVNIAIGMIEVEEREEIWRGHMLDFVNRDGGTLAEIGMTDLAENEEEIKANLVAIAKSETNEVHPLLFSQRIPRVGIEDMINHINEIGIIPFIIKGVEMIDNLRNPSSNQAAVWRDAQEAISYLGPILELIGMDDLAMELNGIGLEVLNKMDPYYEENMVAFGELQHEQILTYSSRAGQVFEILLNATDKLGVLRDISSFRLKQLGSILEKLREKLYPPPDGIGFELIFEDDYLQLDRDGVERSKQREEFYLERVKQIIITMKELGFEVGHTSRFNSDVLTQPDVELHVGRIEEFGDVVQDLNIELKGIGNIRVERGPQRASGYAAAHINFYDPQTEVGVEVKVMQHYEWRDATLGSSSHLLYKNDNAWNSRLQNFRDMNQLQVIRYQYQISSLIEGIRRRFQGLYENIENRRIPLKKLNLFKYINEKSLFN